METDGKVMKWVCIQHYKMQTHFLHVGEVAVSSRRHYRSPSNFCEDQILEHDNINKEAAEAFVRSKGAETSQQISF